MSFGLGAATTTGAAAGLKPPDDRTVMHFQGAAAATAHLTPEERKGAHLQKLHAHLELAALISLGLHSKAIPLTLIISNYALPRASHHGHHPSIHQTWTVIIMIRPQLPRLTFKTPITPITSAYIPNHFFDHLELCAPKGKRSWRPPSRSSAASGWPRPTRSC